MDARHYDDVDPVVAALIRRKAKRLARLSGFNRADEEDLRQDLWLQVIGGMQNFDRRRASRRTFAARIIDTRSVSIVQHARARKRDQRQIGALDSLRDAPAQSREPEPDQHDQHLDVHHALAELPADLAPIAALFMKYGREAPVIRESRLGRQRVRGLRGRIKWHLAARGLS